jgi:cellulose synthase/poly-beta-1,6-N-acetylglucosamine synthase-like glycosyltransferase
LNYFRQELARTPSTFAPFATVICPCKGNEEGLRDNLEALNEQEYPAYEIVFVVDDDRDSAVKTIEEVSRKDAKAAKKSRNVVAPQTLESSQKVENLREAVLHADERSEVFVFVDSDARPSKHWLRSLVAPLGNENVGVATGYRWFISPNPTFGSELRNIWNASIASQLGPSTKGNFCWGGSTAIRRDIFEKLDIREKWRGTVSDDFTVMRAMRDNGLEIVFVPQALTPSVSDGTFAEMLEFTTRQMKITRVYAQKFWLMSFFGSGLFCLVMLCSWSIVIMSRENDLTVVVAIATLLLVTAFSAAKSWLRLKAVQMVLTSYRREIGNQFLPQMTLWAISPFVFFANCVAALFSRQIRWRGITYNMVSATETRVVRD